MSLETNERITGRKTIHLCSHPTRKISNYCYKISRFLTSSHFFSSDNKIKGKEGGEFREKRGYKHLRKTKYILVGRGSQERQTVCLIYDILRNLSCGTFFGNLNATLSIKFTNQPFGLRFARFSKYFINFAEFGLLLLLNIRNPRKDRLILFLKILQCHSLKEKFGKKNEIFLTYLIRIFFKKY